MHVAWALSPMEWRPLDAQIAADLDAGTTHRQQQSRGSMQDFFASEFHLFPRNGE